MNEAIEITLAAAGGAVAGWFGHRYYSRKAAPAAEPTTEPAPEKGKKGSKEDGAKA